MPLTSWTNEGNSAVTINGSALTCATLTATGDIETSGLASSNSLETGEAMIDGDMTCAGSFSCQALITATSGIKLGNNIIYASDGDAGITLTTGGDATIANNLNVGNTTLAFKGADANITCLGHMNFYLDLDNNEVSQEFRFYNTGTEIAVLNESGDLQIDGDLTVSGGNVTVTGAPSYTATTQSARNADTATADAAIQDVLQTLIADLKTIGILQ
jgi:hypothetical protein